MNLTIAERKHRMPHGAQQEVARAEDVSKAYVSLVMAGEIRPQTKEAQQRLRRVQRAIARKLNQPVDEVFPVDPVEALQS